MYHIILLHFCYYVIVSGTVCLSCGEVNGIVETGQCELMDNGTSLTNCSWPESCIAKEDIYEKCNVCIMAFKGKQSPYSATQFDGSNILFLYNIILKFSNPFI